MSALATFADLLGVSCEAMEHIARELPPGALERALLRLALYRLPPVPAPKETRRLRYRRLVRHLVDTGVLPSMKKAIEQVARHEGVEVGTVHEAIYRRPRKRVPLGSPLSEDSTPPQSRGP